MFGGKLCKENIKSKMFTTLKVSLWISLISGLLAIQPIFNLFLKNKFQNFFKSASQHCVPSSRIPSKLGESHLNGENHILMEHHVINLKWKEVHRLRIVVEQLVCLFTLGQVQVVLDFGVV